MSESWFETYNGIVLQQECDEFDHLNIIHYVAKFDAANHRIYARIGLSLQVRQQRGLACVAVENAVRYKSELRSGDILFARSTIVGFQNPLAHFVTELWKKGDATSSAIFEEVACCFDVRMRSATRFPDEVAREIECLIGTVQEQLILKLC